MENKRSDKHDDEICRCPACNSSNTSKIPEEERMMGFGLYMVHDFIGSLYNDFEHCCDNCGYRF